MRYAGWRFPALIVLGSLILQTAWILAMPPFRGLDEFDHAYRAAAVAHGEWIADLGLAEHGRGGLVTVPEELPPAAEPVCEWLPYTGLDNCHAVDHVGGGMVTVASGAVNYNPVFYWAIGTPAMIADGTPSLYVMRAVAALLCTLLLGLAAWAIGQWARTRWPAISLLLALTPVTMYSTSIAAPNGIEMCAALAFWASSLGIAQTRDRPDAQRRLIWSLAPSGAVLMTVKSLGPFFVAVALLVLVVLLGVRGSIALFRQHRSATIGVTTTLGVSAALSAWWILSQSTVAAENDLGYGNGVSRVLGTIPLWFFQSVAAFPARGDRAPVIVYVVGLFSLLALFVLALMKGDRRGRAAIIVAFGVALLVPFVVSVRYYDHDGLIWQGRYGLPMSYGVILLAGLMLERARFTHRLVAPVLLCGIVALAVAEAASIIHVIHVEATTGAFADRSGWWVPGAWLVVLLCAAGWLCWAQALTHSSASLEEADDGDGLLLQDRTAASTHV